ncbi:MAG: AAA family ATPase [Pseudonocardiaceae bacterium]
MIALLTGPPGIGKSSVARQLTDRNPAVVEKISFGQLLHLAVERRLATPVDYAKFRASAASIVTRSDFEEATVELASKTTASDPDRWLVVDSHAVAREQLGWQANPDTPSTLRRYAYNVIILLDAPTRVVLKRIKKRPGGRLIKTERDVAILSALQRGIATYYSGIIGCPLCVIDAQPSINSVVAAVESVLGLRSA